MKGKLRLRRLPSPAMVVAVIALVAALTGAAVALPGRNSVTSNDIKPKTVRGSDIRPGAVDAFKTDVMKSSVVTNTLTTTSNSPVDLGGPNVTVKVPKGGLVEIFAEANLSVAGGGPNSEARIHLFDATSVPNSPQIMGGNSPQLTDHFTAPGTGNQTGVNGQLRGGWLVFSPGAGTHTFGLRYSGAGGGTALFQNTKLYVSVVN
jgi:hypothetical protein